MEGEEGGRQGGRESLVEGRGREGERAWWRGEGECEIKRGGRERELGGGRGVRERRERERDGNCRIAR